MKYIFLLLSLLFFTQAAFPQDVELEDIDDLSILDAFEEDEKNGVSEDDEDDEDDDDEEEDKTDTGDEDDDDESDEEDVDEEDENEPEGKSEGNEEEEDDEEKSEDDSLDDILSDLDEEDPNGGIENDLSDEEKALKKNLDYLEEGLSEEEKEKIANLEEEDKDLKELGLSDDDLKDINALDSVDFEFNNNAIQVNQEGDEEIDFKLIEEFAKYKDDNFAEIITNARKNTDFVYTNFEIEALKTQLKDILDSKLRLAYVSRGTRLTRISDGKVVYTTKPIVVRAYTQPDFNKDRYIINKEGKVLYKTYYKRISHIKKITDLYRKPHKFIRYPKRVFKRDLYDPNFPFSFLANAHVGLNIPTYTNDLILGESSVAPLFRAEFILMSHKKLRFNTGLSLNYEAITGRLENTGTYQHTVFSIGPHFKLNEFWGNLALIFQPRVSIFSQLAVSSNDDVDILKLSETSFTIALESESKIENYGTLIMGVTGQRKWLNTSTQNADYSIGDSTRADDSFTFYIGHKSDWIW